MVWRPSEGSGVPVTYPRVLEYRDDRAHRLRPHRLGPRQCAAGCRSISLQPQQHGFLRRGQIGDIAVLAEAPLQRTEHDVKLGGQGGGFSTFGIGGLRLHSTIMAYMKVNYKDFLHIPGAGLLRHGVCITGVCIKTL